MSTAVIGGSDYPTGHITDANVDLIQLGSNPSGIPYIWATEVENFITAHASNPNGFVIYLPATKAEGRTVESTSPDAANGAYQTASSQNDQAMLSLLNWLQANGYMANTVVAATADEAENDHTSYDNFYGLGSTGLRTTRHVPWALKGPGIVSGPITYTTFMNMDDAPTNIMAALNLPAPVDSRGHVIPAFFQSLNCGPGGTPPPSPTSTPTTTGTPINTNTPTNTNTLTPTPVTVVMVGHVSLQGRPTPPNPHWNVPVSVNLVRSTGSSFDYDTATDQSGYFIVTFGLVPDNYTWRVKNPQTLANSGIVTLAEGYNSVEMGTLREGDANNDNCVNVSDFNIRKATYGKSAGEQGYDPRGDFNSDNIVNIADFNLLKGIYGQCGAPALATPTPAPTSTPTNSSTSTATSIPTSTPIGAQHIVISEFRVRGPSGGNDEFIELYNPTNAPVDVGGWKINGSNNAGTTTTRMTINTGTNIPAHGHFLATNGYSGQVPGNQTYTTGITDDGGIALLDVSNAIVDQSYERKPGGSAGSGQDTNDNNTDFQVTGCE